MRITLEAFGEVQFSRELLRVAEAAEDMRPAFDTIHEMFINVEKLQFSTQGKSASGGWAPLAPATVAYKAAHKLDPRILHATLRLRDSLTKESHPDHIYRADADEMFVGSRVEYGVHHQFGAPRANLPRRRPVEFTENFRNNIVKTLQRHVLGGGL